VESLELTPYFHYVFDVHFGVLMRADNNAKQVDSQEKRIFFDRCESLFQIMDTTKSGSVSFDEFVRFNYIVKTLMIECTESEKRAIELFGANYKNIEDPMWTKASWNRAMRNVDAEGAERAWSAIFLALAGKGQKANKGLESTLDSDETLRQLFCDFDSDGSMELDLEELTLALRSIGVHITDRQMTSLFNTVDKDASGEIGYEEFLLAIHEIRDVREGQTIEQARREAANMINQANAKAEKQTPGQKRPSASGRLTARYDVAPRNESLESILGDACRRSPGRLVEGRVSALGFSSIEAMVASLEKEIGQTMNHSTSTTGSATSAISETSFTSCSSPEPDLFLQQYSVGLLKDAKVAI